MSSYLTSLRRTIKWYTKVAIEIPLGTTMVNAYHLYSAVKQRKIGVVEFRKEEARSLLTWEGSNDRVTSLPKHHMQIRDGPKNKTRRRCYEEKVKNTALKEAQKTTKRV